MNREQQIEKAAMYRCGKVVHHFDGGTREFHSINEAKAYVGPKASCVAERPGENLRRKMQARWEAEEARQKAEAEMAELNWAWAQAQEALKPHEIESGKL